MTGAGVVIVGSSVAGSKTAESLRSEGYQGKITLIGAEGELPYDKPPLSKQVLTGAMSEEHNLLLTEEDAARQDITLMLGKKAVGLDAEAHVVILEGGEAVMYESLVVATGVRARPSPWGQPAGVHLLRTVADMRALKKNLFSGGRLVVIGAGFIGSEVAAAGHRSGMTVQMVDPVPIPMARFVGDGIGQIISGVHAKHGAETFFGVGVSDIVVGEPTSDKAPHPELLVHLADGQVLGADTVVVGIGTLTNHEWLDGSGLFVENGVVCDEYSRAQGVQDVYAVGDIARWMHPRHGELVRIEHWTSALQQAQSVAYNITHPDDLSAYSPVEYVWSDQYEWKIQLTGRTGARTQVKLVGPGSEDRFVVLYSEDGTYYSGAMALNWPKALISCRRAVGTGVSLDELRLTLERSLLKNHSPGSPDATPDRPADH